jgi:hypothetical protein
VFADSRSTYDAALTGKIDVEHLGGRTVCKRSAKRTDHSQGSTRGQG